MRPSLIQIPTGDEASVADATFARLRRVLLVLSDARRRAMLPPGGTAVLLRCCGLDAAEVRGLTDGQTVGRSADCAWPVSDAQLSRRHFGIRSESGQWVLDDCGSKNGTFVNNRRVASRVLADGDWIEAGVSAFVYVAG